jgi:hypothetical protein
MNSIFKLRALLPVVGMLGILITGCKERTSVINKDYQNLKLIFGKDLRNDVKITRVYSRLGGMQDPGELIYQINMGQGILKSLTENTNVTNVSHGLSSGDIYQSDFSFKTRFGVDTYNFNIAYTIVSEIRGIAKSRSDVDLPRSISSYAIIDAATSPSLVMYLQTDATLYFVNEE